MTKEQIYERMTIQFTVPDPVIPCEFDDGKPCCELYRRVFNARVRIAKRTGIDFEDRDLLEIVECMEEIGEICALKMFEYGERFGYPGREGHEVLADMERLIEEAQGVSNI